jgi:cell division protein ZapA (FtsZ GTPase activity inhibitor)
MKNTYKLLISDEQYSIVSDETLAHVTQAGHMVDQLLKEICAKAPHVDEKRIAVLAALQLASKIIAADCHAQSVKSRHEELAQYVEKECLAAAR